MADNKFSASNLVVALNKREDTLIGEALASWLNLPLPELKSIAAEFVQNEELASAIEKSLTAPKAGQKEDLVCKWLYHWYQIDSLETRRFVLRFIPQLIWVYMHNVTNSETPPGVEACLLCIYNQEVVERSDMEIIFQPPTLSLPSYLHKTSSDSSTAQQAPTQATPSASAMLAPPAFTAPGLGPNPHTYVAPNPNLGQSLTENALRQFNKQVKSMTVEKALKPIDLATTANRDLIIRIALQRYNHNISLFPPRSWIAYCKMCKRLVNFGFDFTITPIPLLKSKSFSNKYIEEDMDNLVLDSETDFDDVDDDYPDELSDSDGDLKLRDVEKSETNDEDAAKKKAKSPQMGTPSTPGTPGTPRRRMTKSLRDSASSSSSKIPPLSFSTPRSSSPSPSPSPKGIADSSSSITNTTTTTMQNIKNSVEMNGEPATPKNIQRPPIRIILTPYCLQEMVTGLTFCIFKESHKEHALKALRKIHLRACYDLMPEIILSANALLHLEYQERVKSAPPLVKSSTPRGIN